MADAAIISVENLGKKYSLRHQRTERYTALRDVIAEKTKSLFRRNWRENLTREDFWALKDVSFEVKQGEVLGIIGRNGAGKSTLLKILSRITEPTTGRVRIKGRVASLLEVGTGFHPELTGRENIFLNGAILGMTRAEIRARFDEIVAFAEIERFLDTPVKRYSSGMYVRLAFAVAAHLEPEILVVDEVLAVGDAEFQKKCLGKMKEVATGGGTVLFVSHNMPAVARLTQRCLVLANGIVVSDGSTESAVSYYLQSAVQNTATSYNLTEAARLPGGSKAAVLLAAGFLRPNASFAACENVAFEICVRALVSVPDLRFSMTIISADGTAVGSSCTENAIAMAAAEIRKFRVTLPQPCLAPGHYHCVVAVGSGGRFEEHNDFDIVPDTLHFEVTAVMGTSGAVAYWNEFWGKAVLPEMRMDEPAASPGYEHADVLSARPAEPTRSPS